MAPFVQINKQSKGSGYVIWFLSSQSFNFARTLPKAKYWKFHGKWGEPAQTAHFLFKSLNIAASVGKRFLTAGKAAVRPPKARLPGGCPDNFLASERSPLPWAKASYPNA